MFESSTTCPAMSIPEGATHTKRFDDFTGRQFGWLSIIKQAQCDAFFNTRWHAACQCGKERIIRASQLREGKFFTCGTEECRFWSKVDKTSSERGCWLWTGSLKETGYGVFQLEGAKAPTKCHHYSWIKYRGEILEGKWVLHTCDDRRCVNPEHLYLGTHRDNMDDVVRRGRGKGLKRVRLPLAEKARMREEYRQGDLSHLTMSAKYGVSLKTVGRILRGES
jgi:hypothetical protein